MTQLLSQSRMWAPSATVRLVPNESVPAQQVQDITEALKKAGLNIGVSP